MKNTYKRTAQIFSVFLGIIVAILSLAALNETKSPALADTKPPLEPVTAVKSEQGQRKSLENEPLPQGQLLYENHCQTCHESMVHIRNASKVKSFEDIQYWVGRWAIELEVKWSDEEINAVVQYLNEKYYHY